MFKFIFNSQKTDSIRTAAPKKPVEIILNPKQPINDAERRKAEKERRENEEKAKSVRAELDRPFGVVIGDLSYHPVHNPNVEKPRIEVVHRSLPEYRGINRIGQQYSRGLKQLLRNHKDYESVKLERSRYGGNEDLVKIAPDGLEVFRPRVGKNTVSTEQHFKMIQMGKERYLDKKREKHLRKRHNSFLPITKYVPSSFSTSFEIDPEHPETLIASHGIRGAISKMIDGVSQNAPFIIGKSLCICGSPKEDHVTSEVYKQEYDSHFAKTGRKLNLHGYLPQKIDGRQNAVQFQYGDSPLLRSKRHVGQDDNGKNIVEEAKAFDNMGDDHFIPMVKVGTKGIGFKRFTSYLAYRYSSLQNLASVVYGDKKLCPECKGHGVTDLNQRENSIMCNHCRSGKISYIEDTLPNGDIFFRPHTIGIDGGKFRYVNPKDAPECDNCWGQGHADGVKCGKCQGSGRNMTGIQCTNCNSDDSILNLTPDNTCLACNGKKTIDTGFIEKRKYPKSDIFADSYEGNVRFPRRASLESSSVNTGPILWKGRRDSSCKVCTHDQYLDKNTGLPCECRIARPGDDNVLPSNIRIIHKDSIDIPERHFQEAMRQLYPGNLGNPHTTLHMPDVVSPETGKTSMELIRFGQGHRTQMDLGNEEDRYTGVVTPGKTLPVEVLKRLQAKSAKNWASPTAKFTAASADLLGVIDELKNFSSWNDNITEQSRVRAAKNTMKQTIQRKMPFKTRINTDKLPMNLKTQAQDLESLVGSLPDAKTGRYNTILDSIYESHILSNHKDPKISESHAPVLKAAKDRLFEAVRAYNPEQIGATTPPPGGMPITMAPHLNQLTDILSKINPRSEQKEPENA
jgi:hypothetical protein